MSGWEQEISQELEELGNAAVRFDIQQELTNTEKTTARTNIGINSSATLISNDDYKLIFQ